MAVKNLFGRGIGFNAGDISWAVTHGYDQGPAAPLLHIFARGIGFNGGLIGWAVTRGYGLPQPAVVTIVGRRRMPARFRAKPALNPPRVLGRFDGDG